MSNLNQAIGQHGYQSSSKTYQFSNGQEITATFSYVGLFPENVAIKKYAPTTLDSLKKEVDFTLLQVSPYVIRWNNGITERVTGRKLKKLQECYTWCSNF